MKKIKSFFSPFQPCWRCTRDSIASRYLQEVVAILAHCSQLRCASKPLVRRDPGYQYDLTHVLYEQLLWSLAVRWLRKRCCGPHSREDGPKRPRILPNVPFAQAILEILERRTTQQRGQWLGFPVLPKQYEMHSVTESHWRSRRKSSTLSEYLSIKVNPPARTNSDENDSPHSMDHCWIPTTRPRIRDGANSARYTQLWELVTPIERPLITRPTMRCATFWADACNAAPTTNTTDAILSDPRRPNLSARVPATSAPTRDPADMEAVIPPCKVESGWPKYSRYCVDPIQALIELMSNPNNIPPMVPKAAKTGYVNT